jgi:lipopolysaccharide transport system ATP-binding protein
VRGLTRRYPLFSRRRDRLLAFLGRTRNIAARTVLEDISFEVYPGEAIGIVGENGSGKTTLLRTVAGISTPDAGTIRTDQPVAAILELGLGFHPEFTGRDNAQLYGALLGVPEAVMTERLEEILAFADLGEFVDEPLRTYSSGMAARLAFAVATNVDPKVLVVDEALAVGDGAFQKKCVDRMVRFKDEGRTVLFCSHAMFLIAGFCERAIWLHQGRIAEAGPARSVIHAYEAYLRHRGKRRAEAGGPPGTAAGHLASVVGAEVSPAGGALTAGDEVTVRVRLRRVVAGVPLHVGVSLESEDGTVLAVMATHWDGLPPLTGRDEEEVVLRLPNFPFTRGQLDLTVYLTDETGLQMVDMLLVPAALTPEPHRWEPGIVRVRHAWEVAR